MPAGSVADRRSEDAGGPHGGRGWQRLQGEACELSGGDLVLDECEHGLAEAGWVVQRCFPGACLRLSSCTRCVPSGCWQVCPRVLV